MGKWRSRGRYGVRDSGRYCGRGKGSGRFGCSRCRVYIPRLVSKVITLMNEKKIDYLASNKFNDDIYHQMKITSKKLSIEKEKNTNTTKAITMKD